MKSVLILFAHPKFEQSRINKALIEKVKNREGVTFHDLYELYPDFNIDVHFEKKLLEKHDVIIWHHPFYWFNCPPLLKQWMDVVLEYKWAYGPEGEALKNKQALNVITTGGTRDLYCSEGNNHYSVTDFLRPFEQSARLCGMEYLAPFAVMGTYKITNDELEGYAQQYDQLIHALQNCFSKLKAGECEYLNDLPEINNNAEL